MCVFGCFRFVCCLVFVGLRLILVVALITLVWVGFNAVIACVEFASGLLCLCVALGQFHLLLLFVSCATVLGCLLLCLGLAI